MPENDAIKFHLSNISVQQNTMNFSGFVAALRDARKFTKRHQDTGVKLTDDTCGNHGSWLGAIGYLVLLDQIGKCFKPKNVAAIGDNSISKALKYFTTLPHDQIDALYALRNAFAHDYALYNINNARPTYTHHFTVVQSPTQAIVIPPQIPWDGIPANRTAANLTIVNLEALGDTTEIICGALLTHVNNNNLEVTLPGGSDELLQRYSFYAAG